METRHDAKYSDEVLEVLDQIVPDLDGPVVDPFAGLGLDLDRWGRRDVKGIELEPEWSAVSKRVKQGNALHRKSYPRKVGSIVTSPCYGNRLADKYLGPQCGVCGGEGKVFDETDLSMAECPRCGGNGRDGRRRFGYAISLGRPVSEGSAASLQWGPKYRAFHRDWLRLIASILDPGERRLVLNMSDHPRDKKRQYVVHWWVMAAHDEGFRMVEAYPADTSRIGLGANKENLASVEMVLVFDLLQREAK